MDELLDIYSDYLISQNQLATATGLSDLLNGEISHDKITRFLNQQKFDSKNLWQYVKPFVRQYESTDEGFFIVDDTIAEKTYTDENDIICWHYSSAKGRHVKGINLLSCLIRYGDISLPIGYEIIRKDLKFCDLKTKKVKRQSSQTKNQLFIKMLEQAVHNQIKFKYILGDNWFGSNANMTYIQDVLNKYFILGIKSNRLVALSELEKKRGQYQRIESLDLKPGQTLNIWLKELNIPLTITKKVFMNENQSTGVLYLVTNDFTLDADRIYQFYQKRWKVEEYHKSIKQNASLSRSPTKVVASQSNHVFASLIAYCKLELMKLKNTINHFTLKYKLILRANQIAFQELRKIGASIVI
jgi:hypothetical protein